MWILQFIGICVFLGIVVAMLEASHNFSRWAHEHNAKTVHRHVITKVTTPTVDIDQDGNIIRITDASGRVVFEESGA